MDESEFLELVSAGEGNTVEFKLSAPNDETIARDMVAFANTDGGVILYGVGQDGALHGLTPEQLDMVRHRVNRVASSLLDVSIRTEAVSVSGQQFFAATVPKSAIPGTVRTARGDIFIRARDRVVNLERQPPRPSIKHSPRRLSMFVAMSFSFEQEPALVDYYEAINRAVASSGLPIDVSRMDLEEGDYEITAEIVTRIQKSDLVLSDFTLGSPNVFYEAGVARGANKRMILTARRGTELPFDVKTWRVTFYSNATQLEAALPMELVRAYNAVVGHV